jgi:Fe-S-cluster containining protein
MVKHNLIEKYFHGCGECRACCNGDMFSMGQVTFSDFKKIVRMFPTAFDMKKKQFLFFYSLAPLVGCHYFRDNNCSIYDVVDRPDTCINFPFGIDSDHTILMDYNSCPNLNDDKNDFPVIKDGLINPRVMNDFFTEFQYVSNLQNGDNILQDFVKLIFDADIFKPFPTFKTTEGESIDIKEIDANMDLAIIDIKKVSKIIKKMDNSSYESFVYGHFMSLENLPQFGKRLLQQI